MSGIELFLERPPLTKVAGGVTSIEWLVLALGFNRTLNLNV